MYIYMYVYTYLFLYTCIYIYKLTAIMTPPTNARAYSNQQKTETRSFT